MVALTRCRSAVTSSTSGSIDGVWLSNGTMTAKGSSRSGACCGEHRNAILDRQVRVGLEDMMLKPHETDDLGLAAAAGQRIAVLIPCYNEESAIAEVVSAFRRTLPP